MKNIILLLGIIDCLISCSEKKPYFSGTTINPEPTELKVITRSFTLFPSAEKEDFSGKDVPGLYTAPVSPGDFPPGSFLCRNQKADKPIYLDETPITVYAYSPYQAETRLLSTQIPVRISPLAERTPFYRYGKVTAGHKRIDCSSPTAVIRMRAVLTEVAFRLKIAGIMKTTYTLEAIQVGNRAGSTICAQKALLDIQTGELKLLPSTTAATRLPIPTTSLSTDLSAVYPLRLLPLARSAREGEIEVLFTINRRTYRYSPPAGTAWKRGVRYVYDLIFNGDSLSLKQVNISFI